MRQLLDASLKLTIGCPAMEQPSTPLEWTSSKCSDAPLDVYGPRCAKDAACSSKGEACYSWRQRVAAWRRAASGSAAAMVSSDVAGSGRLRLPATIDFMGLPKLGCH